MERAQIKQEDPKVKRARFVAGVQAGQLRRLLKSDWNLQREVGVVTKITKQMEQQKKSADNRVNEIQNWIIEQFDDRNMKPKLMTGFYKAPKVKQDIETRFITKIYRERYKYQALWKKEKGVRSPKREVGGGRVGSSRG